MQIKEVSTSTKELIRISLAAIYSFLDKYYRCTLCMHSGLTIWLKYSLVL